MSRLPPPDFPTPNVTRSSAYPPPGYPQQSSNHGNYPPQQPTTYPTSQLPQPPPAHGTGYPHLANTHAHASAYSHSSSPPHPSAHLPLPGPSHASTAFPIPSVQGGYGTSNNPSGPPPQHMPQRIATMPTPGQVHNPHSVPYHNVSAPVIAHQPSHSGMSGVTRSVTGDSSHHALGYSHLGQRLEAADNNSGPVLTKAPPVRPTAGRPPPPPSDLPCTYCGRMTTRAVYDSWGGFCKEKHRNEWYARHGQN